MAAMTIKDIARISGVSITTVSRVLNDRPDVSAESRQRVLEVRDLEVYNERGQRAVDHVSFSVKQGEILGVCGVEGNGQTELVNALTGLSPASGSIRVNGAELCLRLMLIDRGRIVKP